MKGLITLVYCVFYCRKCMVHAARKCMRLRTQVQDASGCGMRHASACGSGRKCMRLLKSLRLLLPLLLNLLALLVQEYVYCHCRKCMLLLLLRPLLLRPYIRIYEVEIRLLRGRKCTKKKNKTTRNTTTAWPRMHSAASLADSGLEAKKKNAHP
jgi:hypothetical protein